MPIKNGDTVCVHYTGTLDDGSVFDSSRDRAPLEFVMGSGMLIPGFEAAVMGKNVGDSVTTTIAPEDAYGEHDSELVFTVPRSELPPEIIPEEGMQLQLSNETGNMNVSIARLDDESIDLDANHPLAGKSLTFVIDVVEVKEMASSSLKKCNV